MDINRVQRDRERSRAMDTDLRARRDAWRAEEAARKAQAELRRVEEVAAKAREEAKRVALEQQKYKEEAVREAERLRLEKEAARKEYEAQQAALDAEYQKRVEQEQEILRQVRQKAQEEEDKRRAEEERQRREAEELRRQKEEEERRVREEALRLKLEERKKLENEKQRFAIRLEGSVDATRPPKGTTMPGPLQRDATVRVTIAARSLLGGVCHDAVHDYESIDDAKQGVLRASGLQAKNAVDAAFSTLQLQAMTGEGPMASMEKPEQDHWMSVAVARTGIAAVHAAEVSLRYFAVKSNKASNTQYHMRTEVAVLPPSHPQCIEAVIGRAIALIENGPKGDEKRDTTHGTMLSQRTATIEEILDDLMEVENQLFYTNDIVNMLKDTESLRQAPQVMGAVLALAHFVARMLHDRPAKTADAPGWFETAAALVRQRIRSLLTSAAPDSLEAFADLVVVALGGEQHPIATEVLSIAEDNVSQTTRQLRAEKERARQAMLAEKLLEEEWPDAQEIRAARMAEKESKTPMAERVWALRNVAGTLAMGGPGEREKARQLLEQAVVLKQQFAGRADHPGVLPELMALADVLATTAAATTTFSRTVAIEDSVPSSSTVGDIAGLTLRVLGNIATAYSDINDNASAALVMEAGLRQYEELAGVKSNAVRAATKTADRLLEKLDDGDRQRVNQSIRGNNDVLKRLSEGLTEQLGAYTVLIGSVESDEGRSKSRSRVQEWDEQGARIIGTLL